MEILNKNGTYDVLGLKQGTLFLFPIPPNLADTCLLRESHLDVVLGGAWEMPVGLG